MYPFIQAFIDDIAMQPKTLSEITGAYVKNFNFNIIKCILISDNVEDVIMMNRQVK